MADNQRNRSSLDAGSMKEFIAARTREIEDRIRGIDRNPVAREAAGKAAEMAGNVVGLPMGAWHAVENGVRGGRYAYRLANPMDSQHDAAVNQLANAGKAAADYVRTATPQSVAHDIGNDLHQFQVETDRRATPMAGTIGDEMKRSYRTGENAGEVAFGVASTLAGEGLLAKGLGDLAGVEAATPAKYIAQGFRPEAAEYLAQPYEGMGHHFIPRRTRIPTEIVGLPVPSALAGRPLPRAVMESPLNVQKPKGISRGDFYELHAKADSRFKGTGLPEEFSQNWRRADLGLRKEDYGVPQRLWFGSPAPLKTVVGGAATSAGVGDLTYGDMTEGDR